MFPHFRDTCSEYTPLRLTMVVGGDGSDSRDQRPFRDGTAAHPGYVHSVRAQALSRDGAASYGLAIYNV